jgi:hypothetical protein
VNPRLALLEPQREATSALLLSHLRQTPPSLLVVLVVLVVLLAVKMTTLLARLPLPWARMFPQPLSLLRPQPPHSQRSCLWNRLRLAPPPVVAAMISTSLGMRMMTSLAPLLLLWEMLPPMHRMTQRIRPLLRNRKMPLLVVTDAAVVRKVPQEETARSSGAPAKQLGLPLPSASLRPFRLLHRRGLLLRRRRIITVASG